MVDPETETGTETETERKRELRLALLLWHHRPRNLSLFRTGHKNKNIIITVNVEYLYLRLQLFFFVSALFLYRSCCSVTLVLFFSIIVFNKIVCESCTTLYILYTSLSQFASVLFSFFFVLVSVLVLYCTAKTIILCWNRNECDDISCTRCKSVKTKDNCAQKKKYQLFFYFIVFEHFSALCLCHLRQHFLCTVSFHSMIFPCICSQIKLWKYQVSHK